MAIDSGKMLTQCQFALHLTQEELADLIGVSKRTIQRWQDRGCNITPAQAEALASALRPVRPDLADQVLELGRQAATEMRLVTDEVLASILQAAASAGGVSPDAVRPAVRAAFAHAAELGLNPHVVAARLG
jgi:transcriptional regulator with XRE-family HTH domain